jgi:hypothetical protein
MDTRAARDVVTDRHGNEVPIEGTVRMGSYDPLKIARMPVAVGMFAWVGPALLWAALAQGSGELIWWPYFTAKYGAIILGFLLPASLIQWWYNHEIIRYEVMTGENAMTGFLRIGKWFAWVPALMILWEILWFGGFTGAAGSAIGSLTTFPGGWSPLDQGRFWTLVLVVLYVVALVVGRVAYNIVEKVSTVAVVVTITGLLFACFQPQVYSTFFSFWGAFFNPFGAWPIAGFPSNWDPADTNLLVTAIAFAGAGGWGQVFFTYWFRDKGASFGQYAGRITSPLTGEEETIPAAGFAPRDTPEDRASFRGWMRVGVFQNTVGIFANTLTTAVMCWLAWAILIPQGRVPRSDFELAIVQAEFFGVAWGDIGRSLFLLVAAAFLADAWLQIMDGYCRMLSEFMWGVFPERARRWSLRRWYYVFLAFATVTTVITTFTTVPGFAIVMRGVASFVAMPIMGVAFIYLNFFLARRAFPSWVMPNKFNYVMMFVCTGIYIVLFLWFGTVNRWWIF